MTTLLFDNEAGRTEQPQAHGGADSGETGEGRSRRHEARGTGSRRHQHREERNGIETEVGRRCGKQPCPWPSLPRSESNVQHRQNPQARQSLSPRLRNVQVDRTTRLDGDRHPVHQRPAVRRRAVARRQGATRPALATGREPAVREESIDLFCHCLPPRNRTAVGHPIKRITVATALRPTAASTAMPKPR